MFDDVYDNGECVLGKVINVKEYICKNAEDPEEIREIIHDLEDLDASSIVCINYNHPMGYSIEYWTQEDQV